jgi:leucyl-tRNA synthetase
VNGLPQMIDAVHLPIVLPEVENIYQQKTDLPFRECLVWAWDTATNKVVTQI